MSTPLKLYKLHATGNDFLVCDPSETITGSFDAVAGDVLVADDAVAVAARVAGALTPGLGGRFGALRLQIRVFFNPLI